MPLYDVYLIKKVAQLKVIEAMSFEDAEAIGYSLLEKEEFNDPSDPNWDRYVYVAEELADHYLAEQERPMFYGDLKC